MSPCEESLETTIWAYFDGVGRRQHGQMAMLKAGIDDSGIDAGDVAVLAGFVTSATKWAALWKEWETALMDSPRIEYFKMREAQSLTKEFYEWREAVRDEKVARLECIIRANVDFCVVSLLDLETHRAVCRGTDLWISNPYYVLFYGVIEAVIMAKKRRGFTDNVVFAFDEQGKHTDIAMGSWSDFAASIPDEHKAVVRGRPVPVNDKDVLPIQAADLFAWRIHDRFVNGGRSINDPLGAISYNGLEVYTRIFDREHLAELISL
jgi:hypothetical protein